MILARVEIDFRAPLRDGDELEIGVRPAGVGTKSFELEYEVRSADALAAEAKTVIVSFDYESGRSVERAAGVAGGARRLMGVFERQTLPSGLRLLTAPMGHAQSVSCFIMLAAGSRYETPETSGIAHFAEHMFFKGTENRPTARDIGNEIDGIGGEFNAFTGKEYTGYYVRCAGEHRSIALDVLIDMLRHSKFDPEEIDREKGVIVEEMNMYFDTPRDYISGVYDELLYGDQPLGWDIIGRKETVRAATRDTFLGYIDQWYKPERMVVGVAGKIDGDLEAEIERLLGDLEPAETGAPAPADAAAPNGDAPGQDPHEGLRPGAPVHRRAQLSARPSRPLRAPAARDRPRHGHVVTALHRGPRAARPRVLHLRDQPQLHRRGLALLPGGRRHRAHRRGDHDDRRRAARRSPTRRFPQTSSRRPATSRRGGSCSRRRARTGWSCSGCAARSSKGRRPSRRRSWPGSTRSRPRTSSGSRRT